MKLKKKIETTGDLGAFLRQARETRGLTQTELAKASGFSEMTIYHMETNKGSTRTETLLAVCGVLGLSMELYGSFPGFKGVVA